MGYNNKPPDNYIDPNNSIQLTHYNQFKQCFNMYNIKKVEFIHNPMLLKDLISFTESDSITDKTCLFGIHGSKSRNINSIIKHGFYLPDEVVKRKLIKRPVLNAVDGIHLCENWLGISQGYNDQKHKGELLSMHYSTRKAIV